ncbi:hypothetical protein HK405_004667, partial [Cladochytrium tenue]
MTAAPANLSPEIWTEVFANLPIADLWNASKTGRAWRRYYRGRTFEAVLPENANGEDLWRDVDSDANNDQGLEWPDGNDPSAASLGGAHRVGPVHVVGAAAWPLQHGAADLHKPNTRLLTHHRDFLNTDIRAFLSGDALEPEFFYDNEHRGLTSLVRAGQLGGWKAFALRLYFRFDPRGRLDYLCGGDGAAGEGRTWGFPRVEELCTGQRGKDLRTALAVAQEGWIP